MQSTHLIIRHTRQQGVALFVVIVFVMLSMLLALWASRTSLFNEMIVGNDADYQRAFEAAQALLQDAEFDIRGETPNGDPCIAANCRNNIGTAYKIPLDKQEVSSLLADLDQAATKCLSGLCLKRAGRQDFWNTTSSTTLATGEVKLSDMTQPNVGARYGQYSGATVGATGTANPILADTSANDRGGWYWIEMLPYQDDPAKKALVVNTEGASNDNFLTLNMNPQVVYRITAIAFGRKRAADGSPVTRAIIQQVYARHNRKD
jgi:type IV pilus assembly protein PilX